ncbi:MAG: LemA family protein [Candidatus Loosdrechtia sp.]|uniref:LemA family protein n=1 Tax=Candidatus Loosdrechtia sp. TaxID=3101272 RepID=UPI003A5EDD42|nr:MAG: LemA family protein [Candidatus Jettenia sp. AMX2]
MKKALPAIAVVVFTGILFSAWYVNGYNRVVRLQEDVQKAWAQVDTQLKRRYDLIPNLVETVKGYAAHEKEIFENLAEARRGYFTAGTIEDKTRAATRVEGFLSRLLAFREAYPELKANESFLKLQDTLEGTENRISVERKRYNDAVREYNAYIKSYFGRFFASRTGATEASYFEVAETEKEAPRVKF